MDLTNIAVLGTAVKAMSSGGSVLSDIQTSSGGGSFKGILGDLMNTSADTSAAEVFVPEQLSADNVTAEVMSEGTETALKYLVGSYLQSAAKSYDSGETENTQLFDFLFTDSTENSDGDYTDIWQQLFDSLSSTDISQLSGFSAELSTALFGGGKDEGRSSGDVLTELFDTIDLNRMKAQSKVKDNELALAALASGGFSSLISFAETSPEKEQVTELDMQLTALIGAADDETVEALAAELAEAVSAAQNKAPENGSFIDAAAAQNEVSDNNVLPDIGAARTETEAPAQTAAQTQRQTDTPQTGPVVQEESITFVSYVRRNVRSAEISAEDGAVTENAEKALPRIETGADNAESGILPAENVQPRQTAETAFAFEEKTELAGETGFKTMEQIIEKLEQQADGFSESRELVIKLDPETLGEITVKIEKAADGAVSVTFAAQNREVSELIADRSAQLAQALSDKGTQVRSVNVVEPSQSGQDLAFDMSGQQNAFNFRQQGMGSHHRVDRTSLSDEEEDDISIGGVSESTKTDYVSKEAKLWRKI